MTEPSALRIGIDLGGTKIEYVALNTENSEVVRERIAAPRSYGETVDTITDIVRTIDGKFETRATVGVGMPGALSRATGMVKNAPNSKWMIGHAFDHDLASALSRPVRVENDANCFSLSEASDGAAAGAEVVFGVIIGTGCGGGIIVRGRPVAGLNAIAGEWGHNPLPWANPDEIPGPLCGCGLSGCIETWLSGAGLVRAYKGDGLSAADIAGAAENGDALAKSAIDLYADRLSRALSSVINLLDPDVIVLGGGLSNIDALYEKVPMLWATHTFSDTLETKLVKASHGDSSGVRGAAWLWSMKEAVEMAAQS